MYIIWYRDVLRFWRDKSRLVGAFAFPFIFLAIFGIGLAGWVNLEGDVDFSKFMFPGVIGMTVLMSSFAAGISITWDREFGFLKEVLIAPISRATVAMGKTLGGATIATIQGTIILLLAPLIGITLSPGLVFKLLPLIFLVACALAALGILIASRIKSMEAFNVVMNMLMMPMVFLSGVFFPVSNLPSWMNVLVKINPATYGVDPIRKLFIEESSPFDLTIFGHTMSIMEDVLVVAIFGLLMIALAMWSLSTQE
jgi:ABC-2 type transport system permease protein